jgi:hypothetical protein
MLQLLRAEGLTAIGEEAMAEDQQLAQDQGYPDPLTSRQVQRLESLAPEEEPPEDLTINLSTFRVPEEAQTNVVRVEDSPLESKTVPIPFNCR